MKILTIVLSFAVLSIFPLNELNSQQVTTEWVRNNFSGFPVGVMIGLDQNNNVLVAGQAGNHSQIIIKKFDTHGNQIWERFYSISGKGVVATWLTVDGSGNVIVTGYPRTFSSNPVETGLLTLKYDNDGNLLWDRLIPGTWAFAVRSIADNSGNIYVTGRAWQYTATYDFVTVKYAPDGTQLWFDVFDQNSGFHTPNNMDLDQSNNLFIAGGERSGGLITVMYNSSGTRLWSREKSGIAGRAVKADGRGGVFVTGSYYDVNTGTSNDIMLLKYDLAGNLVWQRFYDFGNSEYGSLLNFDSHRNLYITGHGALPGGFPGWLTAKVDTSGDLLWYRRFKANQSWEEFPYFALTGPQDEIYVTGKVGVPSGGTTYNGLETVRYNSDGNNAWVADVNLYGGVGNGLAIGSDLSLYVVGQYYYSVIKYSQSVTLNLKALIEGFYNPGENKMIMDTVTVYLRSAFSPYSVVDSSRGMLDSNGMGSFAFHNAGNSVPYYLVVKHRNGLETWSSGGNAFISGNLSYDFTTSSAQAYGNNQVALGTKFCMFSGDVGQDGIVDGDDLALVDNDAYFLITGYLNTDLNGDGLVDLSDLSLADNNAYNYVSLRNPIIGDSP